MNLPRLSDIDWIRTGLLLVAILAICSAVWSWYHPKVQTVTRTEYRTQIEERAVEKIKRITVPGPERIVTIEKPVVVSALELPQSVADDPDQSIVANGEITTEDGDVISTVAVMDAPEGQPATVSIIAKEKPKPFFGFVNDLEAIGRWGATMRGGQETDLAARWRFLRVGKAKLGVYGEFNTQPEGKAMLEVSMPLW